MGERDLTQVLDIELAIEQIERPAQQFLRFDEFRSFDVAQREVDGRSGAAIFVIRVASGHRVGDLRKACSLIESLQLVSRKESLGRDGLEHGRERVRIVLRFQIEA